MSTGKSRGRGGRRVHLCKECGRVAEGRGRLCWRCQVEPVEVVRCLPAEITVRRADVAGR